MINKIDIVRKIKQQNEKEKVIPRLEKLSNPARYKLIEGGRGGAKSWSVAKKLVIIANYNKKKILCCREVQKSIKESVYELIEKTIKSLGYSGWEFYADRIENRINGSKFIFHGLRDARAANSVKSFEDVEILEGLKKSKKILKADFYQAIDCRLITEDIAKLIGRTQIDPIRFAWDGKQEDGFFEKAIKTMVENTNKKEFMVYTLYNFKDTPEYLYYRLKKMVELSEKYHINVNSFPMRYQPIDSINIQRDFTGENWKEHEKKGFMLIVAKHSITGQISINNLDEFYYWFGKSEEKFKALLNYPKLNEYLRAKKGNSREVLKELRKNK